MSLEKIIETLVAIPMSWYFVLFGAWCMLLSISNGGAFYIESLCLFGYAVGIVNIEATERQTSRYHYWPRMALLGILVFLIASHNMALFDSWHIWR